MNAAGLLSNQLVFRLFQFSMILTVWVVTATTGTAAKRTEAMSLEEGRNFWAFSPVGDRAVPAGESNPVDAFLSRELADHQLRRAPRADKRTLIRRATYDLTGLPPTNSEVQAFLKDGSTNAFEKVIERLLASKHYGIRWGRHWLDVARYADSNGLDENIAFGHAWRYRDYVIDSFNADKPFDRFIVEQIAGDLVPHASQETITATGFLALGARVLAEKDREKLMMDVVDEQIDTLSKAFLGMTISCARCHDHKFDPISQKDYFGLAAIFRSTQSFEKGTKSTIWKVFQHSFATEAEKQQITEVNKKLATLKSAASSFQSKETVRIRGVARSKATEYLIASTMFDPSTSLEDVALIADRFDLHPRILHHCRLHLKYHQHDDFFGAWHGFAGDTNAIARHYGPLFTRAQEAFAKSYKKDPKKKTLDDPELQPAHAALYDKSGFLAVPPIPALVFDAGKLAELDRLQAAATEYESSAPDLSAAMCVGDGDVLEQMAVHVRGDHMSPGEPVKREFPAVMRWSASRPVLPAKQSGRLELARWIADTRHPLTSRVFVNRVWRWHFGRGLVGTTENFGVLGDRPSNPALLDWLAHEFMKSGWSVKQLHRLIMNSATYQMASQHPDASKASSVDPANQLWWRQEIQRLDAEQIRDSILATAGLLDESMGGKTIPLRHGQFVFNHTSVDRTGYNERRRRAIYLPVVRNHLCDLFQQFDYPDPATPTGNRHSTVVAPQALFVMNSPLVMDAAESLANQILDAEFPEDSLRITEAYSRVFARPPTPVERQRAEAFLSTGSRRESWSLFCQSLLASNEFLYLN